MILCNDIPVEEKTFSEEILHTGLSLYEVFRVFQGKIIFLEDNLFRLSNSIKKSNLKIQASQLHLQEKLNHLIRLENIKEGNIKYVLHITPEATNEYIYQIKHNYPTEHDYEQGVKTITCQATRDNAEVKYLNPALREMTNQLISSHGVYEVILLNKENYITEGSRSNIFFIRNNELYTAPLPLVLPGTSRKRVLELCQQQQIPTRETCVSYQTLRQFDAAFITGTSPLVLPIQTIDNIPFNPKHELLREIMSQYFSLLTKNS